MGGVAVTRAAWQVLYRGPLSSCNYACGYCPFAKRRNSRAELADDARKLERFVDWVEAQAPRRVSVLFTPWGEGLVRRSYQRAMVRLSRMAHVGRAAIQTNLSMSLRFLAEAERDRVALWATWHPSQVSRERFLARCAELDALGVHYSVGVVGARESFAEIAALREALPSQVYLWVNALKGHGAGRPYDESEVEWLESIDPLFRYSTRRHASLGERCRGGESVFSVDGDGEARSCHFVAAPLGNIYAPQFADALGARRCPNATCGCHIGYVHLERLGLERVFGDGILERIPVPEIWHDEAARDRLREEARRALGAHVVPGPDQSDAWAGVRFT